MIDYSGNVFYKDAKERMETEFAQKRADGTLSKVHDEKHVLNVSRFGAVTAETLMRGSNYSGLQRMSKAKLTIEATRESEGRIKVRIFNSADAPIAFFNRISTRRCSNFFSITKTCFRNWTDYLLSMESFESEPENSQTA